MTNTMIEAVIDEFRQEARTTGRVLGKVPAEQLTWRPHPKSLTLGQLALHIATAPGATAKMLQKDEHEITPTAFRFQDPNGVEEIRSAFEQSVKDAEAFLCGLSEQQAVGNFTLKAGGRSIFTHPRLRVVRMIMLSHVYHHRGQLSVYLRLLNVPVPSIYGPSADDNPFAG
jgi:uncharacterized damage-inducible protein DinB